MQHGLSLEDVASRSNIDISTLSRLESGKRRLAPVEAIMIFGAHGERLHLHT